MGHPERNEWARFFESFTMQHDHWLVSVDGEKDSLPLEGIATRDDALHGCIKLTHMRMGLGVGE